MTSHGTASYGCLGHGDGFTDRILTTPRIISAFENINIVKVQTEWTISMALSIEGHVYTFGYGGVSFIEI